MLVVDGGRGRLTRCEIFGNKLAGVEIGFGGDPRARSHCRFAPPLIRFIPYSLRESVPLFLKRQYDQTLGRLRRGAGGAAGGPPHAARLPQLAAVGVGLGHIVVSKKEAPIVRVTPV